MPNAYRHLGSYQSVALHAEAEQADFDDEFVEVDEDSPTSRGCSCSRLTWQLRAVAPALWLGCVLFLLAVMILLPAPLNSPLQYASLTKPDTDTSSSSSSSSDDSTAAEPDDDQPDSDTSPDPHFLASSSTGLLDFNASLPAHPVVRPPTPHVFDWCYDCPARCPNILTAISYHASHIPHRDRLYKYKEIAASLPRFFRGCDHLYLQDVFNIPRTSEWWSSSSNHSRAVMLGDMHLFNFGSFDNNRGELVYDMNDFDQTFIADYHVDLWRTATSIAIHMAANGISSNHDRDDILAAYATTYLRTVRSFVDNDDELDAYIQLSNSRGPIRDQLMDMRRTSSRVRMLEEYTYFDSRHVRRFDVERPELSAVDAQTQHEFDTHWPDYLATLGQCRRIGHNHSVTVPYVAAYTTANVSREAYYTIKSIARRFGAGLGSVGQPRFYVLVEGPSLSQDDDVMLDVKREPLPEWWNFVHADVRQFNSVFRSQGHRIAASVHALLPHVDAHVGYMQLRDGSYLVRSRSPYKGAVNVDALTDKLEYRQFVEDLAYITAVNHCRADNDYNPAVVGWSFEDEIARLISSKGDEQRFVDSIRKYAYMNAERIGKDFECYVKSGMAEEE